MKIWRFFRREWTKVIAVHASLIYEGSLIEENAKNVEVAFASFFKRLETSVPSLPWQIRLMVSELYKASIQKFPTSSQTVIGGFLLLRFICPAIVMPGNLTSIGKPGLHLYSCCKVRRPARGHKEGS